MKKIIVSITIMLISIALLITTANAAFTMSMNIKSDSSTIQVGDTATLTISVNEKIVASNFDISYDSTIFQLEGSATSNLSVAEKDGKIACIYADISGTGISEFKVKFKALKTTTSGTSFKIDNAKFRAEGQEDSYTGEQISGLDKVVTAKVVSVEEEDETPSTTPSTTSNDKKQTSDQIAGQNKTTAKTSLPKTGKETGFIIAGITALVVVAIVFGTKSKELNNIFKSISVFVIAIVAVTSVNKNVYAADVNPKLIYNNRLIGQKYTLAIMLDKSDSDRKITKSELISAGSDIEDVTRDGKSIEDTETIKTGDKVKVPGYTYTAVLYGDSNADGIVCDADDLMTIINNYLGKEELVDEKRLAANLANKDDELDTDDLMQMINMYLGKLDTNLVVSPPNSAIYPNTSDDNEYLENNWTYSLESDNTILLSKYIGKDTDITVKATYSIDGTQYSTRLAESKIEDYKPESVGWICSGPFAANTSIEKVTFESTDIIGNNASYLFYHCTNLKQVIGFGGKITDMTACFEECTSLLNENGEINIPDTVTKLHMAFMNCTSMKILPSISENSKLENGYMAFDGCSSAQSGTIYLNSSVNNIVSMFNGCNMLGYYGGTGFRIYSSINTDTLEAGSAFENCGYVTNGSQGSQEHALIITNSNSSEANKAYEFFSEEIYNEKSCTLEVKIAE